MSTKRHSPEQAMRKLAEGENMLNQGQDLTEVCRQFGIAESTWLRWKAQYGGVKDNDPKQPKGNDAKRLKELETENGLLKRIVADLTLDIAMLKEVAKGNF